MKDVLKNKDKSLKLKIPVAFLLFLFIICLFIGVYALLIYNNIVSSQTKSIDTITLVIGIICFFFLGLFSGVKAKKNGLLEGLLSSLIVILITLVINLILKVPFIGSTFIKIVTYVVSSCVGGIIGVNIIKR